MCSEASPFQVSANAGSWCQPYCSTGVPSLCHPLQSDAASIQPLSILLFRQTHDQMACGLWWVHPPSPGTHEASGSFASILAQTQMQTHSRVSEHTSTVTVQALSYLSWFSFFVLFAPKYIELFLVILMRINLRMFIIRCNAIVLVLFNAIINLLVILEPKWFWGSETALLLAAGHTQTLCERGCGKFLIFKKETLKFHSSFNCVQRIEDSHV